MDKYPASSKTKSQKGRVIRRDLECGGKIVQSPKGRHYTEERGKTPACGKPEQSTKKITE
jgi:hypothetical protein